MKTHGVSMDKELFISDPVLQENTSNAHLTKVQEEHDILHQIKDSKHIPFVDILLGQGIVSQQEKEFIDSLKLNQDEEKNCNFYICFLRNPITVMTSLSRHCLNLERTTL